MCVSNERDEVVVMKMTHCIEIFEIVECFICVSCVFDTSESSGDVGKEERLMKGQQQVTYLSTYLFASCALCSVLINLRIFAGIILEYTHTHAHVVHTMYIYYSLLWTFFCRFLLGSPIFWGRGSEEYGVTEI